MMMHWAWAAGALLAMLLPEAWSAAPATIVEEQDVDVFLSDEPPLIRGLKPWRLEEAMEMRLPAVMAVALSIAAAIFFVLRCSSSAKAEHPSAEGVDDRTLALAEHGSFGRRGSCNPEDICWRQQGTYAYDNPVGPGIENAVDLHFPPRSPVSPKQMSQEGDFASVRTRMRHLLGGAEENLETSIDRVALNCQLHRLKVPKTDAKRLTKTELDAVKKAKNILEKKLGDYVKIASSLKNIRTAVDTMQPKLDEILQLEARGADVPLRLRIRKQMIKREHQKLKKFQMKFQGIRSVLRKMQPSARQRGRTLILFASHLSAGRPITHGVAAALSTAETVLKGTRKQRIIPTKEEEETILRMAADSFAELRDSSATLSSLLQRHEEDAESPRWKSDIQGAVRKCITLTKEADTFASEVRAICLEHSPQKIAKDLEVGSLNLKKLLNKASKILRDSVPEEEEVSPPGVVAERDDSEEGCCSYIYALRRSLRRREAPKTSTEDLEGGPGDSTTP